MPSSLELSVDDYTLGWVCALDIELAAARIFLDAEHPRIHRQRAYDDNVYILGNIARHNVVLSLLPSGIYGKVAAATVAQQMRATFPNIGSWLMIGIGGGVPDPDGSKDVRLGDIVVSTPGDTHGGVIQYDLGKTLHDGKVQHKATMNSPHQKFLTAIALMKATQLGTTKALAFDELVRKVIADPGAGIFHHCYPGPANDYLYQAGYVHQNPRSDCTECDPSHLQIRTERSSTIPRVHYGLIASGDQVMKDAATRDRLARQFGMKCFEMEAAGMMNSLSCLVVRGICDYCDSHKLKGWQPYAALVAAGYTRTLLEIITVDERQPASNVTKSRQEQKRTQLSRWISGCEDVDTGGDVESNTRLRHGDTCSWLFRDESFVHWRDNLGSESTVWYHARLGSGKTVLSAAVVEHLRSLGRKTVYFCYSFKNPSRRNFLVGLRSLAVQLINHPDSDFPDKIEAIHAERISEKTAQYMPDALAGKVFQEALRPFSLVYVVIDGLDECSNEKSMVQEVASLISEARLGLVKWFLTSRDEKRIRDQFTKLGVLEISPTPDILWTDIKTYLSSGLQDVEDIQEPEDQPEEPETGVVNQWTTICDGNFLYSKFVLETLQEYHSVASRRRLLREFPKDLQGWYLRALVKLCDEAPEDRELVRRTFVYLVHAQKSMTWTELRHAVSIDRDRRSYDGDYLVKKARIQQLCGSFLISDNALSSEDGNLTTVRLSHKTVLDFLVQDVSKLDPKDAFLEYDSAKLDLLRSFFPNTADAIQEIGLDCLRYLSYKRYRDVDRAKEFHDRGAEEDVFLTYASAFWFRILTQVQPSDETSSEVCRFLQSPNFWTSISLQTFIAPYLFSRYERLSDTSFYMNLSQPGSGEPSSYGHPMPAWLSETECGRKLDRDFCQFLTDWHEVLASHPGQLQHCVPLRKMTSGLGRHLTPYPSTKACRPQENMGVLRGNTISFHRPLFKDNCLQIEMMHQEHSAEEDDASIYYYCRGQAFGKGEVVKRQVQGHAITDSNLLHFSYRESDSKIVIWYLRNSPLRLEKAMDGDCETFEAPDEWQNLKPQTTWNLVKSRMLPTQPGVVGLYYLSKNPPMTGEKSNSKRVDNDRVDDEDSGFQADADSDSDTDDDMDEVEDDDDSDVEDDDDDSADHEGSHQEGYNSDTSYSVCSKRLPSETEGVVLIRESSSPLWILLGENAADGRNFSFAFRPNTTEGFWKSTEAESSLASVLGLGGWHVRELRVENDAQVSSKSLYQDLHFSVCGEYLYMLDLSFLKQTDPSYQVTLYTYRCPLDQSHHGPLEQLVAPQRIAYRITRRLAGRPLGAIYTHWGEAELVMTLPPSICKSKVVKFTLPKEHATSRIDILSYPIYLPATMTLDSMLMYQRGPPGKKHQLFVHLLRKSQGDSSLSQRPVDQRQLVVIRWLISRKAVDGWRPWNQQKDSELEGLDKDEDVIQMLRGKYVDEGIAFIVPIRSGLDWTRKSYLSCC